MNLEDKLASLLGGQGWIGAADSAAWHRDWLNKFGELPLGVARPMSIAEVSEVLKLCAAVEVPVVPQGGNTSLAGAAVVGSKGGVILSLSRMDKIGEVDKAGGTITVGAGAVLANLHEQLDGSGFMFPLHIGAEGSAQIGGLIGTNAGGSHAFRHGMMQDLVLGLEVVLPDGTVWEGMRRVQKDNAGYQLRKLFCGAEGTLGVVTRAVLKLVPTPIAETTCLLAVRDMAAAIEVAAQCRAKAGEFLSALEFFSDVGLDMALINIPDLSFPLQQRSPFYILVEAGAGSPQVPIEAIFSEILEYCFSIGLVVDGAIAMSKAQRNAFWRIREEQPEGQRREGAQLKHDLSVPPQLLADFLERASSECQTILDGVRINPFGHLGDGNVHYNLSPPLGEKGFFGLEETFALRLGWLATEMGGSFAAEHGLGRAKVALADQLRDPLERALMARLKSAFDEKGNFNPGVIVATPSRRVHK
ncbi:FAD-binding oxidoreductase [Shimia sp. FJ5]|uniref:FAD-binding oxidoreductase n=1 Tax=Shimia sp. FJ5 TaxID=3079054 RepID=UPI00293DF8AC|nr:FAD-binding oxidoreductase [Shimia sp. FJ5]MDV4144351.1 FAD-binding oxidoreductase [Shimia sp. FJ5]